MEQTLLYLIAGLTGVAVLLLAVLLLRRQKPDLSGFDGLRRTLLDEFERARRESADLTDRQSARMAQAMDKLQVSNEQRLEQMRATVDEKLTATLHTRLDASFKTVSQQLENVYKSLGEMQKLTGDVQSLGRLFSNVKSRGTWAEVQLEGLLDDILPGRYERNFAPNEGSRESVEFAVRLPVNGGETGEVAYLPIDSKFPVEDYQRLCDAADAGDAEGITAARKALEARVLGEARTVKKYILPPRTTPFAILYLATEGLFAEIARTGLIERIQRECGVTVAGPTTMAALLSAFAVGWRAVAVNKKAAEISKLLSAAKKQYDVFGEVLEKAQQQIQRAGQTLGDAQKRNDLIQRTLRTAEDIDETEAAGLLTAAEETP